MNYKVTHTTRYSYREPVPLCHNELRLTPRIGNGQQCESHHLLIKPDPAELHDRVDYFGNRVCSFSILESHRGLAVTATSHVAIRASRPPAADGSPPWESVRDALRLDTSPAGLANYQFVFDSPRISTSPPMAKYAFESFSPAMPIVDAVRDLTHRIYEHFTYDPRATSVQTTLDEAFTSRRGVCQDFAHVEIACLRSLGLAARYVSGYLRTDPPPGKPRLIGADASHAWVSVYCGACGWIDFDPTNNVIPQADHITLAWGRDYDDVCPIRGVLVGGRRHTMSVAVDVEPIGQ